MDLMLGTFTPKLDEKSRLIIPARFRNQLKAGLVITRGQERCLYILPSKQFAKMYRKISTSSVPNKRAFSRLFTADAISDEVDKQGRVVVPENLREYANLTRDLVVIGAGKRIEVWDTEAWESYQKANVDLYSNMSEEIF
ncbi:MAG: division/cell wall cluster transcriptional repressor MraZ [Candidatus Ancillula sp.]|jgi:MraZ protein|nr:division/cell wall cluster transcriptional repressor MraZ [Candidatus Ancillula sp.]